MSPDLECIGWGGLVAKIVFERFSCCVGAFDTEKENHNLFLVKKIQENNQKREWEEISSWFKKHKNWIK